MSDKLYWTVLVSIFAVGLVAGKIDRPAQDNLQVNSSPHATSTDAG